MKRLDELELQGKRVLVRVDFNVPLNEKGEVTSIARLEAALPTIDAILAAGGRPILMSHLGRPKGKIVESLRMLPVAEAFQELSGLDVRCAPDCIGTLVEDLAFSLPEDEVLILENLRFHPEEKAGDEDFGRALAKLGECYVNDAFGTAHRAHASVAVVPGFLPCAAGLLLAKEHAAFAKLLNEPERPFVAILGGAKVSDKLPLIENLLPEVDSILIGGAMAYTFLAAEGVSVGDSLVERDLLATAKRILEEAARSGKNIELPMDHLAALRFSAESPYEITEPGIPDARIGLDIGPKTRKHYRDLIKDARTVLWNGPMGVFEMQAYRQGTEFVAEAVAACSGYTVVGGGDSVAAVEVLHLKKRIDHVSTGGGASLALLEGKTLPGFAALDSSPA